jgi:hypothetical protein
MAIRLGYEIGSGAPVDVPLRHLAVTGQTQESGKTTTLEALVDRAGVTALAFVTKRGERAFEGGRRVQPYFRDRADWQFVTSILDATLQEKNKFLRPWIMKICRSTRSLADVQRAVRKALETAKGINEGVYTQLDAYLDLIVPEIQQARLASRLELGAGLNVMDVSASSTPMQMLYIQSALDFVNEQLRDTVVIVPEAWEFIPEGKGSPVKAAATTLVRKGAGIGNYIWVDSQDMAGVDKTILRGCAVWIIGVQREANEIKRNLANIPASIKRPTAAAVATLERGQFYACWGAHSVKTYVQPAWLNDGEARAVAMGGLSLPRRAPTSTKEHTVNETEARELRADNARLRRELEQLKRSGARQAESSNDRVPESAPASGYPDKGDAGSTPVSADALYQDFKRRILAEPAVLRVLGEKKTIDVAVKRQTIELDGSSWMGRVAALIAEGFFDTPQKSSVVFREATRRGATGVAPRADEACKKLLAMGFLTREEDGFQAVEGMKVNIVER